MDPQKKKAIFTICCIVVIILAAVLLVFGGRQSEPPKLTVSNEYGNKISAQRGTFSWETGGLSGGSQVLADSAGPLYLYKLGELEGIEPSENDSFSLTLEFGSAPKSVSAVAYPESSVETDDITSFTELKVSGNKLYIPTDDVYIIEIWAEFGKGKCSYYFYTKP